MHDEKQLRSPQEDRFRSRGAVFALIINDCVRPFEESEFHYIPYLFKIFYICEFLGIIEYMDHKSTRDKMSHAVLLTKDEHHRIIHIHVV